MVGRLVRKLSRVAVLVAAASTWTTARAHAQPEADPLIAEPPLEPAAPTVARVLALARERSERVTVARAELGVARAAHVGARLAPVGNPYLEVQAERGTAGTKDVLFRGLLALPVEVAGQRGHRVAEAVALVAWQEASLDAARALTAGEAVRALGTLAVAAERVRTIEELVASSRSEAEVYAARLAAGDTTQRDVKLSRLELARNVVFLAESRADVTRALADLNRVTGARFTDLPVSAEPPALPAAASRPHAAARSPLVRALSQEGIYHATTRARLGSEAVPPLQLLLTAGRGDLGEARFGGGLGFTLPVARANQGERARADAERARAIAERDVRARALATTLTGLYLERAEVNEAIAELRATAEPAAHAAIEASVATERAGKGDLLAVLTARRDLGLLKSRRLDLLQREWTLIGEIVAITGELP
jgi:cobalt-zinc-cadmium efflux system outer membrane protein